MLYGKRILIGVCGGIAAYKAILLIRLLIKEGAEVKVICTPDALNFVTPLTLSTLSKNPVYSDFFNSETGEWNNHVELGSWADVFVIAPLTASSLSKMANGQSDNLLIATYLSSTSPLLFAPAMDLDMYQHPTTKKNITAFLKRGHVLVPPGSGELASGLSGEGRLAEPEDILKSIQKALVTKGVLKGKKVLITAGPTYESIDPVRFIGNRSSGKMGYALAKEAVSLGADVVLVSGPSVQIPPKGVKLIQVESTSEMNHACQEHLDYDIAILSAAVADFKVKTYSENKIKKKGSELTLELTKTIDILSGLGKVKKKNQVLVGFALESQNPLKNAEIKLKNKNLDYIVLNTISTQFSPFDSEQNQVQILDKNNNSKELKLMDKTAVAKEIFKVIHA